MFRQLHISMKNNWPTYCHLLFYFTSYVHNMFRTLIYPSSGACDCAVELPHWSYCSWFDVCWSFGVVGLEWYPCCRLIRSLRLFCWITTLVLLLLLRCVLEFRCGWVGVVSLLQASACNTDTTPTQPHRNSNTHQTKNNTTNVIIQQNSRKLLMMDILMPETCWAHKKWNKIASDIKLVFYSSTITKMHGPINIRFRFIHKPWPGHKFNKTCEKYNLYIFHNIFLVRDILSCLKYNIKMK